MTNAYRCQENFEKKIGSTRENFCPFFPHAYRDDQEAWNIDQPTRYREMVLTSSRNNPTLAGHFWAKSR
jgi:hypothetical protein